MTTRSGPPPQQQPFYCSVQSLESREDVFGTASTGDFWLLVEYAGVWAPHALEGSALPVEIKARLTGLPKTIPRARVLFIRQARTGTDYFNLFAVRARESGPTVVRLRLRSYADLMNVDFEALAAGEEAGGERTSEPLFLVCTHGRRDKCCAKFGWPLYKSLKDFAGTQVWQSSHVGGDRFAANLVCFPHGLYYARVDEESGRRIVEQYRRGRLVAENYRGRVCYTHPVQAAEFFVRRESKLSGVEDLRHTRTERVADATRRITFAAPDGLTLYEALVSRRQSEFRNLITCHAHEEKSVPQYALEEYRVSGERTLVDA